MEDPAIVGDSLVGYDPGRRSIPLAQIKRADVRKIDAGATVGVMVGIFAVMLVIGALTYEGPMFPSSAF